MRTNTRLNLSNVEKQRMKSKNIKAGDILDFATDELEILLEISAERARKIHALADFQRIPSIGLKFAEDLIFMEIYSVNELKGKNPAQLTDEFEIKKGYWIDPCVEDQFRLAVFFANTTDSSKNWWHFTAERKKFRLENGYPANRPQKAWHEMLGKK